MCLGSLGRGVLLCLARKLIPIPPATTVQVAKAGRHLIASMRSRLNRNSPLMSKVFAALILTSVAITLAWDVALVWGLVHLFQG